jgi:hypothetical protein
MSVITTSLAPVSFPPVTSAMRLSVIGSVVTALNSTQQPIESHMTTRAMHSHSHLGFSPVPAGRGSAAAQCGKAPSFRSATLSLRLCLQLFSEAEPQTRGPSPERQSLSARKTAKP